MPKARSIVVAAYKLRPSSVGFHQNGKKYLLIIPPGYADDGVPKNGPKPLPNRGGGSQGQVVNGGGSCKNPGRPQRPGRIRPQQHHFRGKFGSFHQLVPFFTEQELEDHWGPLKTLRLCKGCTVASRAAQQVRSAKRISSSTWGVAFPCITSFPILFPPGSTPKSTTPWWAA